MIRKFFRSSLQSSHRLEGAAHDNSHIPIKLTDIRSPFKGWNHLLFSSSFDHDGHFEDSIVDEGFDVDKIVQTQMMIEAVRDALSKLNDKEREIIDRLYFNGETIRSVAEMKKISSRSHKEKE